MPDCNLDALNRQFGRPGRAEFVIGEGGLPKLRLSLPTATAEIYLQGAHVAAYRPVGTGPILWRSVWSNYLPGKPLRGGVPLCWPWFGPHPQTSDLPMHGLARTRTWEVREVAAEGDAARIILATKFDGSDAGWPHPTELELAVTVDAALDLELRTRNAGTAPLTLSEALHTYLNVADVRRISVHGLGGTEYLDRTRDPACLRQPAGPLKFTEETDRVFMATEGAVTVEDPLMQRRLVVSKRGSRSTVVWNPWINKARNLPDYGDDEWPGMVCIETANVATDAVTVAPGQTHALGTRIEVQPLG